MAQSTYDAALARLLVHEGGYTNHPADPGGPTNFGITIADYRQYVKRTATAADVRAMSIDDAKAIYRAHYWNAMRCDELPAGLDYAVFDFGVNSGNSRAVKFLQQLIGVSADGRMTDATLAAIRKHGAAELVTGLCDARLAFLKRLSTWPVFGAGWGRRVAEVKAAALTMAKAPPVAGKLSVPVEPPSRPGVAGAVLAVLVAAWRRWRQRPQPSSSTGDHA